MTQIPCWIQRATLASCLLLAGSLGSLSAGAAAASETQTGAEPQGQAAAFPQDKSDLPADADVLWGSLPNGVRYAVLPHRDPPERVSVRLLVQAGSLMETQAQRGLAHFLEHMAFNGTTNYPAGELVDYLQRLGMGFGADTNAHTGMNETVYKLDMPHSDAETLKTGLGVMRDYADGILLEEKEIARERGVILSEKRAGDTVDYRSWVAAYDFLLPQALLPQRLPIGQESVISNATREDFLDYYHTWYRPERMAVVVVGDVDAEAVQGLIHEAFESLQPQGAPRAEPDLGSLTQPGLAAGSHYEAEASATEVGFYSIVPDVQGRLGPDTAERVQERLRERAVNAMLNRRLQRLSQEPGAPFSEGHFFRYSYLDFFVMTGAEITCTAEQWQDALALSEQTLRQALEFGFSTEEIAEARAEMLRAAATAVREKDTRKSAAISNQIVRQLSNDEVFLAPETAQELTEAALAALDPATALETLRQMWQDENRWVFVNGTAKIDNAQETVAATFVASQKVPVQAPQAREAATWLYTDFGAQGLVVEEHFDEELGIHQVVFANHVRFNFKHTDFDKGKALVDVSIAGGLLELPEAQPALAAWADLALLRGGLKGLDWDQTQTLFAGREVGADFSVDDEAFRFSGVTSGEDLQAQLQLLAAYLLHAGYRPEGAQAARREFEQIEISAHNTLMGMFANEAARFLAGGSYRVGLPSREAFDAEDLESLQQWLEEPLAAGYLEVSIVGDVAYKEALAAVAATFGALPERAPIAPDFTAARASVHFPKTVAEKTFHYNADEDRALAFVAWPTIDMSDIRTARRLSMLSSVVGDRLRLTVRQQLGEGYSPYAYHKADDTFKDYGYLAAMNILKPASAQEISTLIREIGADVARGPISEDEFKRALEPIRNYLQEYRRSNRYWLNVVLAGSQAEPQKLERARSIQSDYESITLEELQALAAKYLQPGSATIVQVLPRAQAEPQEQAAAESQEQAAAEPQE